MTQDAQNASKLAESKLKHHGMVLGVGMITLGLGIVFGAQACLHTKLAEMMPVVTKPQETKPLIQVVNLLCTDPAPHRFVLVKLSPGVDAPHLAGLQCLAKKPTHAVRIQGFSEKLGFDSVAQATEFVRQARVATKMRRADLSIWIALSRPDFGALISAQSDPDWLDFTSEQRAAITAMRDAGVTTGGLPMLYAGVATGTKK